MRFLRSNRGFPLSDIPYGCPQVGSSWPLYDAALSEADLAQLDWIGSPLAALVSVGFTNLHFALRECT